MSDLIDRQTILKRIEKIRQGVQMMDDTHRASIIMNGMHLCEEAVRNQQSAQPDVPERNVGKWIKVGDNSYRCSVCGEVSCCNGNFCPDCGVDMRERRTDE